MPTPDFFIGPPIIAVVLVLLGFGIGLSVLIGKRRKPSHRQTVVDSLSGVLWAFPVLAVLTAVLFLAAPGLRISRPVEVPDEESAVENVHAGILIDRVESLCGNSPGLKGLPAWVCHPETHNGEDRAVVIVGEQFVTAEEAERSAMETAEQLLRDDFNRRHPIDIDWSIPLELVQSSDLLRNRLLRRIERTSGETTFDVRQMILQLELSQEGRELIYPVWREQVVGHRLWILSRVLLLLTGILTTTTLYFRLDAHTDGQFRRRLKLATIAVIVAVGILIETASPVLEQML